MASGTGQVSACSGCTVQQSDRVAWNIHNPTQKGDDGQEAKGWFSRFDRPTNEIKEIASVGRNTITFTSPLSIGYRVSHSAQLTRYTVRGSQSTADSRHVVNAGVENLSLKGGADGALIFQNAAYSWAKNVEITQWLGEGVVINGSFPCRGSRQLHSSGLVAFAGRRWLRPQSCQWLVGSLDRKQHHDRCQQGHGVSFIGCRQRCGLQLYR